MFATGQNTVSFVQHSGRGWHSGLGLVLWGSSSTCCCTAVKFYRLLCNKYIMLISAKGVFIRKRVFTHPVCLSLRSNSCMWGVLSVCWDTVQVVNRIPNVSNCQCLIKHVQGYYFYFFRRIYIFNINLARQPVWKCKFGKVSFLAKELWVGFYSGTLSHLVGWRYLSTHYT